MARDDIPSAAEIIATTQALAIVGWCVAKELLIEVSRLHPDSADFLRRIFDRASDHLERLSPNAEGATLAKARDHLTGMFAWADREISKNSGQPRRTNKLT